MGIRGNHVEEERHGQMRPKELAKEQRGQVQDRAEDRWAQRRHGAKVGLGAQSLAS
jgi:hypothetical protein